MKWFCQRAIESPPTAQPLMHGRVRQSSASRPDDKRLSSTTERQDTVSLSIGSLLSLRGPSAVTRAVRPVVVDALQCVQRPSVHADATRPPSHVSDKGREGLPPFATDGDTSLAVEPELARRGAVAAIDHRSPHQVLRELGPAMRGGLGRDDHPALTPTTLSPAMTETAPGYYTGLPAVAQARPHHLPVSRALSARDKKRSVAAPDQIVHWHIGHYTRGC